MELRPSFSITIGTGMTEAAPGTHWGMQSGSSVIGLGGRSRGHRAQR
jgi:hypothetical protein